MTLQQLRYLIAIANHGSISAAAHTLYVSQSSLSVAVRDIERETGVTIFERSNRGITLTSDGIELLGYARQVVEQADLMEQRYSGRGGEAALVTVAVYTVVFGAYAVLRVRRALIDRRVIAAVGVSATAPVDDLEARDCAA